MAGPYDNDEMDDATDDTGESSGYSAFGDDSESDGDASASTAVATSPYGLVANTSSYTPEVSSDVPDYSSGYSGAQNTTGIMQSNPFSFSKDIAPMMSRFLDEAPTNAAALKSADFATGVWKEQENIQQTELAAKQQQLAYENSMMAINKARDASNRDAQMYQLIPEISKKFGGILDDDTLDQSSKISMLARERLDNPTLFAKGGIAEQMYTDTMTALKVKDTSLMSSTDLLKLMQSNPKENWGMDANGNPSHDPADWVNVLRKPDSAASAAKKAEGAKLDTIRKNLDDDKLWANAPEGGKSEEFASLSSNAKVERSINAMKNFITPELKKQLDAAHKSGSDAELYAAANAIYEEGFKKINQNNIYGEAGAAPSLRSRMTGRK